MACEPGRTPEESSSQVAGEPDVFRRHTDHIAGRLPLNFFPEIRTKITNCFQGALQRHRAPQHHEEAIMLAVKL